MPNKLKEEFASLDNIACNTEVHLQILTPTNPIRLRTRLIGVDPNNSIILAIGDDRAWMGAKDFIQDAQGVIVRLLNSEEPNANILAFRTNINGIFTAAGRWLTLAYPKELQKVVLRQHSRIPINIEAELLDPETDQSVSKGHLIDISINGGGYTGQAIAEDPVDKNFVLKINVKDSMENISMQIKLRNQQLIDNENMLFQYGFTLNSQDDEAENFVQKVILTHLTQKPKEEEVEAESP